MNEKRYNGRGVKNLAMGIVRQACVDYNSNTRTIIEMSNVEKANADIMKRRKLSYEDAEKLREYWLGKAELENASIRKFFRSEQYKILCDVDGDKLIKMLDKRKGKKIHLQDIG